LSQDNKWLYVLDPGTPSKKSKEHKNGIVHVIDVEAVQLVSAHEVGTMPSTLIVDPNADDILVLARTSYKDWHGLVYRLKGKEKPEVIETGMNLLFVRRFADQPGFHVFANEDMRFLPDHDSISTSLVPLNPKKSEQPDIKKLGGNPGEVLYLPDQKKMVITIYKENGEPTSKVAIVNLAENKVEYVITTGRGGIKFGKFMGSMALSIAATSLSYYGGYASAQATGSPIFFYNTFWFGTAAPNLELTSSADGKYVYSLNTQTNDITIINSQDGTVLDKIAVGGGCRRIGLTPGGRFIYSHTDGQINLIDTQTNKKFLEHHVQDGTIKSLHLLEADRRMVALTSKALLVWDVEKGTLENTVTGFAGPYLLVEPY
jgi:YVTN family beta-propeller protein